MVNVERAFPGKSFADDEELHQDAFRPSEDPTAFKGQTAWLQDALHLRALHIRLSGVPVWQRIGSAFWTWFAPCALHAFTGPPLPDPLAFPYPDTLYRRRLLCSATG